MAEYRSSMPLFDDQPEVSAVKKCNRCNAVLAGHPCPSCRSPEYRVEAIPFGDPSLPEGEKPRLSPQHLTIAARLREGPATNLELGAICQRFGARLWELKRAGFLWSRSTVKAGVYRYELVRDFPPEA